MWGLCLVCVGFVIALGLVCGGSLFRFYWVCDSFRFSLSLTKK